MKQSLKIFLIVLGVLVGIVVLDTLQAKLLKNSPLISWKEKLDGDSYVDKGILMNTYYCIKESDIVNVSWHLKNSKFTCPIYENNKNDYTNSETIDISKIDEDKIINTISNYEFLYEPTIENLYENSPIVLIATFDKDLKTYSDNGIIRTNSMFNTIKVIKNTSDKDVSKNVTIKANGGIMNLKTYLDSPGAHDILKEKNLDIKSESLEEYYINDPIPYTLDNNKEYLLFIDIYKDELYPSEIYHGIKEIKDKKAYDYFTKSYVKTDLID